MNSIIIAVIAIIILAMIYRSTAEGFESRADVIVSRFGQEMAKGPPIRYGDFKRAVPDGDPAEFNAVRIMANNRSADPMLLSSML